MARFLVGWRVEIEVRVDTMDGQAAGAVEMELPLPRPKGSVQFRLVKDFVPPPPRCYLLPLPRPPSRVSDIVEREDHCSVSALGDRSASRRLLTYVSTLYLDEQDNRRYINSRRLVLRG